MQSRYPLDTRQFEYHEWHYLWDAVYKQYPEKTELLEKIERLANEAFPRSFELPF